MEGIEEDDHHQHNEDDALSVAETQSNENLSAVPPSEASEGVLEMGQPSVPEAETVSLVSLSQNSIAGLSSASTSQAADLASSIIQNTNDLMPGNGDITEFLQICEKQATFDSMLRPALKQEYSSRFINKNSMLCLICEQHFAREDTANHLANCTGLAVVAKVSYEWNGLRMERGR